MYPVRFVATVVTRKSAVQPSSPLPAISPNKTTNPDKIPTRLITTWTNVSVVIPRIMMCPPEPEAYYDIAKNFARCICGGKTGGPGEIRTPRLQLRGRPLYPAEPRARRRLIFCKCPARAIQLPRGRRPSPLGLAFPPPRHPPPPA